MSQPSMCDVSEISFQYCIHFFCKYSNSEFISIPFTVGFGILQSKQKAAVYPHSMGPTQVKHIWICSHVMRHFWCERKDSYSSKD